MEDQPIIVKRIKKVSGGHHGGAWKVAFADFATAMMAFFMVMWLTVSATPEQIKAIEGYFKDPVGFTEGGSPNPIDLEGSASIKPTTSQDQSQDQMEVSEDTIQEMADNVELRQMQQIMEDVKKKIEQNETLQRFKDQLILDITEDGLRIQIVDRSNRPMFDSGSAQLKYYSEDILFELAKPLSKVPNKISVTGHTDATPYVGRPGYTNWELSAERANTARRALVAGGVRQDQIARVVGLADSVLFDKNDPAAPINRRIAIIVLNQKAAQDIRDRAGQSDQVIDLTNGETPSQEAHKDIKKQRWLDNAEKKQVDKNEVSW
ncbi:flagellar motor protein MotB [Marinobacteraceae bacterium S3BR75-40.1]